MLDFTTLSINESGSKVLHFGVLLLDCLFEFSIFSLQSNYMMSVMFLSNTTITNVVKTYPPIDPIVAPLILITFISVTFIYPRA